MAMPARGVEAILGDARTASNLIDELGAAVAARYNEIEATLIEQVRDAIARGVTSYPDLTERLRVVRELREASQRVAAAVLPENIAQQVIEASVAYGRGTAVEVLGLAPQLTATRTTITSAHAVAIAAMQFDLSSSLGVMNQRIIRFMPDAYQRGIAMIAPRVVAGVETIQRGQRLAVERFLADGITGFVGEDGRRWRIGSYAEMATRTAVNRAMQEGNHWQTLQNGIRLVQIVIGADACKICSAHAGKVYSIDGTPGGTYRLEHATTGQLVSVTVVGTIDEARSQGWNHPNCRCTTVAYMPGLGMPQTASTYDPRRERARDRQRELERKVRYWRRREVTALDDLERQRARRKTKQWRTEAERHARATGQARKRYRETLAWSDGPGIPPATRRTSTPTARPPAPTPPRQILPPPQPVLAAPVDITGQLRAAATPDEVQRILATKHGARGIAFEGLTGAARMDMPRVKQWAARVDHLLDKYPTTQVERIVVEQVKDTQVMAYASFKKQGDRFTDPKMITSIGKLRTGSKADAVAQRSFDAGWWHKPPENVSAMDYVVTHEWGHLLDYTARNRGVPLNLNAVIREAMEADGLKLAPPHPRDNFLSVGGLGPEFAAWRRANMSDYARKSREELVAEAFADAELNGDNAKPLSRAIHRRMLDQLKGTNP